MVGHFNNFLSVIDRASRQKISEDIVDFNGTINQLDLIGIYRIPHLTTAEYTYFRAYMKHLSTWTTFWAIKPP